MELSLTKGTSYRNSHISDCHMKINVVQNAKKNMVFGTMNRIVSIICPFISRTVIQIILGSQYLGLNSLFSSIIQVLNISELGIGAAIVYSMYKPIAENDTATVNALLNFYRKVYAVIGIAILVIGTCLVPFLPYLISGSYPEELNLIVLYMIYVVNTSLSYFLYAYMQSLIIVYQRDDINSRTNMVITLLLYGTQIIILLTTQNYYLFLLMMPVFTIANNLRIAYITHRMFPQYHPEGRISKEMSSDISTRVKGALIQNVCHMSRNSFDSICVSTFMGLSVTAIYNNYFYITNAITRLLHVVTTSLQGGIGNHVATKTIEENFRELKEADFAYMWMSGWCAICLLCLFQPFMRIWMGEEMMFSFPIVVLFCLYFYLLKMGDMRSIYMTTNGFWWEHRYRALVEAIGNLVLNIVLCRFFGVYGIIIATILTIFICNFLWGSHITFRLYFGKDKLGEYYRYQFKYLATTVILCVITYLFCIALPIRNIFLNLIVRGILCVVIPNVLWILLYHHKSEFSYVLSILRRTNKLNNNNARD